MAYRLAFSSVWLVFLGSALLQSWSDNSTRNINTILISSMVLGVLLSSYGTSHKQYPREVTLASTLAKNAEQIKQFIPSNAFILAEHGQQFKISYFLDRVSASKLPENPRQYANIYRLLQVPHSIFMRCVNFDQNLSSSATATECVRLENRWILTRNSKI